MIKAIRNPNRISHVIEALVNLSRQLKIVIYIVYYEKLFHFFIPQTFSNMIRYDDSWLSVLSYNNISKLLVLDSTKCSVQHPMQGIHEVTAQLSFVPFMQKG